MQVRHHESNGLTADLKGSLPINYFLLRRLSEFRTDLYEGLLLFPGKGFLLAKGSNFIAYMALTPEGIPIGFAEATIRIDYVNGSEYSPVAFLEGIYVLPEFRQIGVARDLVRSIEAWGVSKGCVELASDADIDNTDAHQVHRKLGFLETQRVVYFKKIINTRNS